MDIEREIDRRIQLMGLRLCADQDELRWRLARQVELDNQRDRTWRRDRDAPRIFCPIPF